MKKFKDTERFNFVLPAELKTSLYVMADSVRKTPAEFLRSLIEKTYDEMNQNTIVQVINFKEIENAES